MPLSGRLQPVRCVAMCRHILTFQSGMVTAPPTFYRNAGGLKKLCTQDLYFMHAFRAFPEHHLFFHVHFHLTGHPIIARCIFVWQDSFWSAALLMFHTQLECWARLPVVSVYFQGFGCDHWLLSPFPLSKCIYPLDGLMCVFRYSTNVFEETKAKLSTFESPG